MRYASSQSGHLAGRAEADGEGGVLGKLTKMVDVIRHVASSGLIRHEVGMRRAAGGPWRAGGE